MSIKRFIPITLLVLALGLFFYFRLYRFLSFEQLKQHRGFLVQWTRANYLLSVLLFLVFYIVAVAISIPGATIFTLTGGFLFGTVFGTLYVVVGATLGAILIFLATRYAFADSFAKKAGSTVQKMEQGFRDNAFNYLLALRLVPLFPFWIVNIVPALLKVPLKTYALTTFFGIIPGTAVYVSIGSGLGSVFDRDEIPNMGIIFEPQVIIPLLALGILSILPVMYKKYRHSQNSSQ